MRRSVPLLLALLSPGAALADTTPPPAAGSLEAPTYERNENHKYGFAVDVPAFFTRKPADADGRGQTFEYAGKARLRAWAMVDNPPMTLEQLYGDWTRRDGVTFKTLVANTWIVRGREGGRLYYSRSILSDDIISTVEVSYAPEIADVIEPVLARVGATLMVVPGEGLRAGKHR